MIYEDRQYQEICSNNWFNSLMRGKNSLVAVPTGAGKTIILCKLVLKWITQYPDANILILSHTQEILQQDEEALLNFFPQFGVGMYCAGLGRKEVRKITVGSVHSVYNSTELFGSVTLSIVDEVHAVNAEDSGMYRFIFNALGCTVGGMSATVFRTSHGYLYEGDSLFNDLAYDLTSVPNFNRLVRQGYLCKLIGKGTDLQLRTDGISKSAGDFNVKQLSKANNVQTITRKAVQETIEYGKDRKKWLIFGIDITHANSIYKMLLEFDIQADILHSKVKKDRGLIIHDFKDGSTRALVSVGMVTTGFDAPNIDLIAIMRPTWSPVLHVQMPGRGLRVHPDKQNCLVLDFGGNIERLGPINDPYIAGKHGKKGTSGEKGLPLAKKCPKCKTMNPGGAKFCEECGHEFTVNTNLKGTASSADILNSGDGGNAWIKVTKVLYNIHEKYGRPSSLKVTYMMGLKMASEWICLNHTGYAKYKADYWVKQRFPECKEFSTEYVYQNRDRLRVPTEITVEKDGRYLKVKGSKF